MAISGHWQRLERGALAIFAAAGVSAFALSQSARPAWGLAALCLAAAFLQLPSFPARAAAGLQYLSWTVLGATVLLGLVLMAYPILSMQTTNHLSLAAGYTLSALALAFSLAPGAWPVGSGLFPAALGAYLVACFNPRANLQANLLLGGVAVFAWLGISARPGPGPPGPRRGRPFRPVLLGILGITAVLTAGGIIRLLPWAQSKVEQATFESYLAGTTHYSIFSTESTLGDIARLKLSPKIVMRVWSPRAQKLRGRVFTLFNGTEWRAEPAGVVKAQNLSTSPAPLPADRDLAAWLAAFPGSTFLLPGHAPQEAVRRDAIRTKVLQAGWNEGMVLLPGRTILLRIAAKSLATDEADEIIPPLFSGSNGYEVLNRPLGNVVDPGEASPQIIKQCLNVPEDTDPRIRDLAARLSPPSSSAAERIQQTLNYLQHQCHYSLEVGTFHSRQPVAEFLFEKKRGYCQYFASAAAILLRLEGVPARYVTGFNIQEDNREGDHYVVREMDSHAWVEAYVAGSGWMEIDPTPEEEYEALHARLKGGWWPDWNERMAALAARLAFRFKAMNGASAWHSFRTGLYSAFRWAVIAHPLWSIVLLLIGTMVVAGFIRRIRHGGGKIRLRDIPLPSSDDVPSDLRDLIHRVDRLWAEQGVARPASVAPLEHLKKIPPGKISPQIMGAAGNAIHAFYRICFGGQPYAAAEIAALQRELEQAQAG